MNHYIVDINIAGERGTIFIVKRIEPDTEKSNKYDVYHFGKLLTTTYLAIDVKGRIVWDCKGDNLHPEWIREIGKKIRAIGI
jgi:hypothetical protein